MRPRLGMWNAVVAIAISVADGICDGDVTKNHIVNIVEATDIGTVVNDITGISHVMMPPFAWN